MKTKILRWLLLGMLAGGIGLAIIFRDQFEVAALQLWVQQAGPIAPLLFILIYALGTVLFLPGSVLTLAGGALFGPVLGTLYNLIGATIGATMAYLVARYLASDWVEQKVGGNLKQLKAGIEKEGWRFVAFVRLVPLFPFNLLNYALGLTRIPLPHFVLASFLFMLPGATAYTYLGYAGGEAAAGNEGLISKALIALALLAIVAFLPRIVAQFRRGADWSVTRLKQALQDNPDLLLLDLRNGTDYHGELGHLDPALNLPLESLKEQMDNLRPLLEKPVALICTTDKRSARAAKILARNGFRDVHIVAGGMKQWRANGW